MSVARTVSSVALGALGALGNQTTNQPVVNNNITINSNEPGTHEQQQFFCENIQIIVLEFNLKSRFE